MSQSKRKYSNLLIWSVLIIATLVAGLWYWRHSINYPSTDDAYIQANVVQVAAEVAGKIANVYVANNQYVKKGTLLFQIDPLPYEFALARAQANLNVAVQAAGAAQDAVNVAKSMVVEQTARLNNTQLAYDRNMPLVKNGTLPKAQGDEITAKLKVAQAGLKAAQEKLKQAQHQLGDTGDQNAQVKQAKAQLDIAELDLKHTKIYAPAAGYVTNLNLRQGAVIANGQVLFVFIESGQWWVDANFKETQLKRLKVGQAATVTVDIYPDQKFKGVVQSISYGSGAAFSLLPPENATGNWVKVTQRFPVRISLLNPDVKQYPLRLGSSSVVVVDTVHNPKKVS